MNVIDGLKNCQARYQALDELSLVKIIVTGHLGIDDLKTIISKLATLHIPHFYGRVYNLRDCSINLNTFDLYDFARISVQQSYSVRLLRIAVLIEKNDEGLQKHRFFDTTAKNVGMTIEYFTNLEDAIVWCTGRIHPHSRSFCFDETLSEDSL